MAITLPNQDHLSSLPSELLDIIFSHLATRDLISLRGVSHGLNSEVNSNAAIISKSIVSRERSRIEDALVSRPSFENLTLLQTLRLYTNTVGVPSLSPSEIDLHSRRLASWYRASNAKNSRGAAALAWERSAAEILAFYFYLHHALQKPDEFLSQMSGKSKQRGTSVAVARMQQLGLEAWSVAGARDLKKFARLETLAASTNAHPIPSPWQQADALTTAFHALAHEPLTGALAQDTQVEIQELRRISARVAAARSAASTSMFDTAVSGNPTAALEWALTQKVGLPHPGAEFWFAPRPAARKLFEGAIVRVRDFAREPLLVAAMWESVDVRPI